MSPPQQVSCLRTSFVDRQIVLTGRQVVAWGVSPRKWKTNAAAAPQGRQVTEQFATCRPFGAFRFVHAMNPGAYAPGYNLPLLRSLKRSDDTFWLLALTMLLVANIASVVTAQEPHPPNAIRNADYMRASWERQINKTHDVVDTASFLADAYSEQQDVAPEEIPHPDPVREAFNNSIIAETARNFDDAIRALEDVDREGPNRYFVNVRLGWLNYLKGDFDNSIELYRAAIEDNPASTEARVGLMLPMIAEEKYEDVIEVANATLELEPSNYLANLRLAFALRKLQRRDEAEVVTAAMIDRLPTDLDALAAHALTLLELKKTDDADLVLHRMLLIDPDNQFALEKLQTKVLDSDYEAGGDLERHRTGTTATGAERMAAIRAAFNRSFLAEKAIHYDDAIEELMAIGDPGSDRYFIFMRLGWLHYMRGNFGKSLDYYLGAIEDAPESTEAKVGYLLPLLANKQFGKAIEVAKQVLEIDPRNYYANLRLAVALRELKRVDESMPVIEQLVNRLPADLDSLAEYSKNLVAVGHRDQAETVYHRMLLVDPKNDFALTKLGLKPPGNDYFPSPETFDYAPKLIRSVTPYYAHLEYGRDSIKQNGNVGGLFLKASRINSLELATELTNLRYRDGFDLHQTDFITNFNYLEWEHRRLRLGGRVTSANNDFIDGSYVIFLGAHAYKNAFWDIGSDVFVSRYDKLAPNKTIFQLSPHVGIETKPSLDTRVRLDFRMHYINTENDIAGLNKSDFYSSEARLQIDYGRWSGAIFGWTGEQTFAVRNDGYIVYSLAELHTGGYSAEAVRTFSNNSFFTFRYNGERFADFQTLAPTHSDVFSFLYTYLW